MSKTAPTSRCTSPIPRNPESPFSLSLKSQKERRKRKGKGGADQHQQDLSQGTLKAGKDSWLLTTFFTPQKGRRRKEHRRLQREGGSLPWARGEPQLSWIVIKFITIVICTSRASSSKALPNIYWEPWGVGKSGQGGQNVGKGVTWSSSRAIYC